MGQKVEKWLTVNEAADYASMHVDTIRTLMRRGELTAYKRAGSWRTKASFVDSYMKG